MVYLGSSLKNTKSQLKISMPERYILYIGERWDYKNFEIFLKSIIPLLKKDKDIYLICGGSNPFNKNEIKYFKYLDCEHRVLHIKIDNDVILANLYKHAMAFIFPSLYEGFGIPILESFSCGCPVILSNSSSFPEVAGDAGVYFNPEDELSIRKAIESVIYDDNLREEMKKKGYKQLSKFSWEKTALQTKKVYESLI